MISHEKRDVLTARGTGRTVFSPGYDNTKSILNKLQNWNFKKWYVRRSDAFSDKKSPFGQ